MRHSSPHHLDPGGERRDGVAWRRRQALMNNGERRRQKMEKDDNGGDRRRKTTQNIWIYRHQWSEEHQYGIIYLNKHRVARHLALAARMKNGDGVARYRHIIERIVINNNGKNVIKMVSNSGNGGIVWHQSIIDMENQGRKRYLFSNR